MYEHWRPDKDVCFYVGKGRDKRAWDFVYGRNQYHQAVIGKLFRLGLTVEVRIVGSNLSDADALKLEMERIALYGADTLTNLTHGGEGNEFSKKEVHEKISKTHRQKWLDKEFRTWMLGIWAANRKPVSEERRRALSERMKGFTHTEDARARISAARKKNGWPAHVREAQRLAVTGKKRAPFTPETIAKMRIAATKREAKRRESRNIGEFDVA